MKKLIMLCIALLAFSSLAQAQGVGFGVQADVLNFTLGGMNNTVSVSSGDMTSDLKNIYGLGIGGGLHIDVSLPILSFRVSGDYLSISPDRTKYQSLLATYIGNAGAAAVNIEGGRIDIYSANVNAMISILPLPVVSVYVTGGVGLVRVSVASTTVTFNGTPVTKFPAAESQTKPAVNAGVGASISLAGVTLFGELKIDWIFTDPKASTAIPFGTLGITL
jgi:opacity protein-like surface antigen